MEVGELGLVEDEGMTTTKMVDEINWEHLLNDALEKGLDFLKDDVAVEGNVDSWMGDLEQLLMKDDHGGGGGGGVGDGGDGGEVVGFQVSDILLDWPEEQEVVYSFSSPEEKNYLACSGSEGTANNNNNRSINDNDNSPNFENTNAATLELEVNDSKEEDTDDDPVSKKQKRQLRNRDAAMRSRERKKMYVKDLEVKSRYLEAECRRLGRLLQCCYAENHMLRFSLQSGSTFATSMAKPESAVLLPESLLLGSLVWLMVLMCVLPLPSLPLLSQGAAALGSVNRKDLESATPRGKERKAIELWRPLSLLTSKRCRASRTKMKSGFGRVMLFV